MRIDDTLPRATDADIDALFAPPPVTVLGIGNVILQDEGFGVRVVELLDRMYDFPDTVQLIDGGTLGVELLQFVTGTEKLLVIDSIDGGVAAGTMFRFQDDAVMEHFQDKLSAHEVGIQDVLATLAVTGRRIPEVVVIGAQPYDVGAGVSLTEPMKALLPKMAEQAVLELARWDIVLGKKDCMDPIDDTIVAEEKIWE